MRRLFNLGVLAAIVFFGFKHQDKVTSFVTAPVTLTQQAGVGVELSQIEAALERHRINYERYPRPEQFDAFMERNFRSRLKDVRVDHWGTPYHYRLTDNGRSFELRSAGPDKILANDDDLRLTSKKG